MDLCSQTDISSFLLFLLVLKLSTLNRTARYLFRGSILSLEWITQWLSAELLTALPTQEQQKWQTWRQERIGETGWRHTQGNNFWHSSSQLTLTTAMCALSFSQHEHGSRLCLNNLLVLSVPSWGEPSSLECFQPNEGDKTNTFDENKRIPPNKNNKFKSIYVRKCRGLIEPKQYKTSREG